MRSPALTKRIKEEVFKIAYAISLMEIAEMRRLNPDIIFAEGEDVLPENEVSDLLRTKYDKQVTIAAPAVVYKLSAGRGGKPQIVYLDQGGRDKAECDGQWLKRVNQYLEPQSRGLILAGSGHLGIDSSPTYGSYPVCLKMLE